MDLHDGICSRVGTDDFSFKYSRPESGEGSHSGKAFKIEIDRRQGRGHFKVTLECEGAHAPVRLLIEYAWPPSREHVWQDMDLAAEAVFTVLGEGWTRVLAEARIRGQVDSKGDSGVSFLANEVLHLSPGEIASLETPLSYLALNYETEASDPKESDPFSNPKRVVSLEVLRDDPKGLYLELMSQWPQLAGTPTQGTIEIDARNIRSISGTPSEYLRNGHEYLNSVVLPLFTRS